MSKENAIYFLAELIMNNDLKQEFNELKPDTPEGLVSFAEAAELRFTPEELREVLVEIGAIKFMEEEEEDLAADFPVAVNSQITDGVRENTKVLTTLRLLRWDPLCSDRTDA